MVLKNLDAAEAKKCLDQQAVLFARLWKRNNPWLKRSAGTSEHHSYPGRRTGKYRQLWNCMTRLRLGVHDSSLVDPDIKRWKA